MSIRELEKDENTQARYAFLKAFDKIKNHLSPDDPETYWNIASINGQPFKSPRTSAPQTKKVWRGDSQHENVLFLSWYRAYLLRLENALVNNTPVGDQDKGALHYWDETSDESLKDGLPSLLTVDFVEIDDFGNTIPNPLLGYILPNAIPLNEANQKYTKAAGYTTCRYPFSGLMNPRNPSKYTTNSQLQNNYLNLLLRYPEDYLNQNIVHSLNNLHHPLIPIKEMYERCLDIDNYNQFSNIVSATGGQISLEQASINMLHTLGGNSPPSKEFQIELVAGSHGDLGAKEMAAFDPLFFLHMANVDRIFWLWQTKYQVNTVLQPFTITPDDGTKPKNGQGPSPTQQGDQELDMNTPLNPFTSGADNQPTVTNDIIDIVNQLNYGYTNGSITLEQTA
ncbi:uncharacterized protein [Clytia hemisphaerica]|uniref:Tyrosinase copper-binding domain-containing protein n=1 Tax=Clytia hemisphaerica TaxID=252671 RepID=A0A7M5V4K9_9CNID